MPESSGTPHSEPQPHPLQSVTIAPDLEHNYYYVIGHWLSFTEEFIYCQREEFNF